MKSKKIELTNIFYRAYRGTGLNALDSYKRSQGDYLEIKNTIEVPMIGMMIAAIQISLKVVCILKDKTFGKENGS